MNKKLEIGNIVEIEIRTVTTEGKGIGFTENGTMIIIDDTDEDDQTVRAQITGIFEETIIAQKKTRIKKETRTVTTENGIPGPYQLDEEEPTQDEDEDDE